MLHTPKEIADLLVQRYGNAPKSILIPTLSSPYPEEI